MRAPELTDLSLRQLHQRLAERVFAIPKLQREFVWNGAKAAALLDSVYCNMPIGSVLVWETKRDHHDLLRQSLHVLPPFNPQNSYGWFLIDGQQRLSVLHRSFEGGQEKNAGGQVVDFRRLCFALSREGENNPEGRGDRHPGFVYRKPVDRHFIPIQDILASNWRRRHKTYPQYLLKKIESCREQMLGYRVPVVIVRSDELEEVREAFIRINSQGMKIGAADRAFARASTIDLRHLAHELRVGLNPGFHDVSFNTVLQGFTFLTSERELDVGQRALESTISWWERRIGEDGQQSDFYKRWGRYRTAFGKAVDHLYSYFCVLNNGFLPSENMLATLSVFFHEHPAAPNARQRREICKWFWATGIGKRYSGRGYRRNLIDDVRFFKRLAGRTGARFSFTERLDPLDIARTEYTQASAITSAFYCLLAQQKPCYVENGQCIPCDVYASRANRSDRHHVFPRQLLQNSGFSQRDRNSLCNICFIAKEENQRFGMKRPDNYLAPYWRKRHFRRAMRSHLIPYKNESGIRIKGVKKAYNQFRRHRLSEICLAFEKEAGMKLFRKM